MSESRPDIGRMVQEELDKAKIPPQGEKPLDIAAMAGEAAVEKMIDSELRRADVGAQGEKPLDLKAMENKDAETAIRVADLGAAAAGKIQVAFEKKNLGSLGPVVDEYVAKAKAAGVDEAQARSVLREQLQQFHDTYKEAGLDAKAAEIDSFGRSLENAGEISSEAGKNFLDMLEGGAFDSEADANSKIEIAVKSGKLPGTEVNVLMAKMQEHFAKERKNVKQKGIEADESDIDNALGMLG